MSEWIENCSVNGRCRFLPAYAIYIYANTLEVDWGLFGQVLRAGITILNAITQIVFSLITVDGHAIYPDFSLDNITDSGYVGSVILWGLSRPIDYSSSVYDCVTSWLSSTGLGANVDNIARDLQSHRDIGQGPY